MCTMGGHTNRGVADCCFQKGLKLSYLGFKLDFGGLEVCLYLGWIKY